MLKNLQAEPPETPDTRKIYYFYLCLAFSCIKRSFSSVSSGNNFYHHVAVKNFTTTYLNLTPFFMKLEKSIIRATCLARRFDKFFAKCVQCDARAIFVTDRLKPEVTK